MKDSLKDFFRSAALTILLTICFQSLSAQQPYIHNYAVSDGLPSFEVYNLFQDSKGFIWFATDAGVSCYDGYRFRNFTSRDGLPDNVIFGFFEDSKARIWFRSYNGLLSYFDGNVIVSPPVNTTLRKLLTGKITISMYVDRNDTVWLGRRGDTAIIRILPGFSKIDYISSAQKLSSNFIREMEPEKYLLHSNNLNIIPVKTFFQSHTSASPVDLGISGIDMSTFSACKLENDETCICYRGGHCFVKNNQITGRVSDSLQTIRPVNARGNRFWLCLAQRKGAQLIERIDGKERLVASYLKGYSVTGVMEDREGGIWFTTLEKGVFYIPYPQIEVTPVPALAEGEKITAFSRLPDNSQIISTSYGKLFSGTRDLSSAVPAKDKPGYISALLDCGTVFAVGSNANCLLLGKTPGKYTVVHAAEGPIPILGLSQFDTNRICGVSIRACWLIDKHTGFASPVCPSLPDRMRCICRGSGDTLWLGGLTGLWMYVPGQDIKNMSTVIPLLGQRIDFMYYDKNKSRLWLSSKGDGLLMLEGNKVSNLHELKPAIAATCRSITADASGRIWVATNAGAFMISETAANKFTVKEFSMRNGLPVNDIVGLYAIGDSVWIASSDRLLHFFLNDYPHNTNPPSLLINQVSVNGHHWVSTGSNQFNYDENTIAFTYTGIDFKSFGHVHYRFRLNGADSSWKETQSNEVTFYGLPPGEYHFCLQAFNNDGIAQLKPLEFSFIILRPFWCCWWFVTGMIVLGICAVAIVILYLIRRGRRKGIMNLRLIELEMTALRAQMNPHFIFNAINSIHNFVLKGDRNSSAMYLAKFARLIRNVLENSAEKQIPLAKEIETVKLYMEIERMRFSDGFTFAIEIDSSINLSSVMIVPMLLQPYVENAIWHGLLHKKHTGRLLLSVERHGDHVRIGIDDDGVGRAEAAQRASQRTNANGSMGGAIGLRRLNLLSTLYGAEFSLTYTDKKNFDGSSAGTSVELLIPTLHTLSKR